MIPKQWHIYRVKDADGQSPHLVIQPTEMGEAGLNAAVCIPLSSAVVCGNAFPLRISLKKEFGLLPEDHDLHIDRVHYVDNDKFSVDLGSVPDNIIYETKKALKDFFDLTD